MAAGALGSVSNRLRHENGDTHVVICDDVFSDAGSTPAASTIILGLISLMFVSQAFLVYLIRPNFAVRSRCAPHDLPATSGHVPP